MEHEPLTPEWWVHRLYEALSQERKAMERAWAYYTGNHDLPFVPRDLRSAYATMLERSRANFCRIVPDAVEERLRVQGFRLSGSSTAEADKRSWEVWQANGLDAESQVAFTEALVKGRVYFSVWPGEQYPTIMVEDATQVITENVPGSRRERAAGLKVWLDDWTGETRANLYLPTHIVKFVSTGEEEANGWERWEGDGDDQGLVRNPLGVVPLVPMVNRPSLVVGAGGESELTDVMPIQDRINETLFNRSLAAWTAAYRQKWATGLEVPEDEDGNPVEPYKAAIDRLWVAEDPDVRFGSFDVSDLGQFINAIEQDVLHIAVLTRTPRHYLIEQGQSPSGDAIKSAETGLVAKVRRRHHDYGESLEEVLRLARKADNQASGETPVDSEVIWGDPEYRSEGERVDALVKMAALGVPREAIWEKWGASPQEIARWKRMAAAEALVAGLSQPPTGTSQQDDVDAEATEDDEEQ